MAQERLAQALRGAFPILPGHSRSAGRHYSRVDCLVFPYGGSGGAAPTPNCNPKPVVFISANHMHVLDVTVADVMAGITNATSYPNAVPASRAIIHPDLLDDSAVYPSADAMARLFQIGPVPLDAERARTRMWARVKAGQ